MIKHYHSDVWRDFQKSALARKGGRVQEGILQSALNSSGQQFTAWLEKQLRALSKSKASIIAGDEELPLPEQPRKYTAAQFNALSGHESAVIWETWKNINPGVFCSAAVWGYIVSCFIRQGKIEPYYLLNGFEQGVDGREAIEEALKDKAKTDDCIRGFLRRFSGLPPEKGARSVYQNCPPAVAWWQHYIAAQSAENIGKSKEDVYNLLSNHKELWELLTDKMASQLTVLGDQNIRDGLILFLLKYKDEYPFLLKKEEISAIINGIGIMSAWRALGFFSPYALCKIIHDDIFSESSPEDKNA